MPLTELLGGAIAITLIGLASAAILAWTVRRHADDRPLLLFGVWCALYGVRLISEQPAITNALGGSASSWSYLRAFITYLINIPIGLFLESLIGPGWKMSVRRVWQIEAIYAAIAIAGDLVLRAPRAMMGPNSPLVMAGLALALVNVWMFRDRLRESFTGPAVAAGAIAMGLAVLNENLGRPLVPGLNLEPLGVLAFVAALGHGVVSRAVRRETELVAVQRELETARQIQSRLLPRHVPRAEGLDVAARYVPMNAVAGDVYDFVTLSRSQVGIMVADVSGHGVPAALGASMVKLAFSTQVEHAHDPAIVLAAMNRILCRNAEGTFVTAVYAVIDTKAGTITVANAGHPSLLIGRARGPVEEIAERGLMLGVVADAPYANGRVELRSGDRLLLYTDGIPETQTARGEFLDLDRLKDWLRESNGHAASQFADAMLQRLRGWRGGASFDDDVTLVVAQYQSQPSPVH